VQLARRAGAEVIATVGDGSSESLTAAAGAHHVLRRGPALIERVRAIAPAGVHHIVEAAFAANILTDLELLAVRGSIAAYATDAATPTIPFWPLLFKNIRIDFLGSDDFEAADKTVAANALNGVLAAGWQGLPIAERFTLDQIAAAHEHVEAPVSRGRVVVLLEQV
jgi:NADPH2:quinone reductase